MFARSFDPATLWNGAGACSGSFPEIYGVDATPVDELAPTIVDLGSAPGEPLVMGDFEDCT